MKKAEIDQETKNSFNNIIKALMLIKNLPGNKGKIICPACNGNLHWTKASINGHVWGKCETENCLSWAQ